MCENSVKSFNSSRVKFCAFLLALKSCKPKYTEFAPFLIANCAISKDDAGAKISPFIICVKVTDLYLV